MRHLRELASLGWPMLVAQLAVMANAVADTMLTGHYDATHLAAIGIGASVYFTVFVTSMGMLQSLSPLIARRFGAGEFAAIGVLVRQGVLAALALSIPGTLILANPGPLLAWVDPPPDVAAIAASYLRATAIGVPATMLARVYIALVPAVGWPRTVMAMNLASLSVKVPLSWALIYGAGPLPELGGPGAGLASSVVGWLVLGAVAARLRLGERYRRFEIFGGSFAPDWPRLREITVLGVPIGLTFLVDVTAYTFMALFLARLGATVSGAHQIVANLGAVVFMVPLSIGAATQILIGRSLGARSPTKAREIAWEGVRLGLAVAVAVSLALLAARAAIVDLYTSDPAVAALALALLPILAAYHLGDAVQGVATQALRGYHRNVLPLAVFVVVMWGIGLGGGYTLAFHGWRFAGFEGGPLGATGFWLAAAASVTLLAALLCAYLARVARHER